MPFFSAVLFLLTTVQEPAPNAGAGSPQASQEPVLRHTVSLGEEPFAVWDLTGRIPLVWPVHGPGGIALTRPVPAPMVDGKPADHAHHVSFWTAHGDVNGIDFWHDPKARIVCLASRRSEHPDGGTRLWAELAWRAPDGSDVLMEERTLHLHGTGDERLIDRTHIFRAPADRTVVFGDTKEGTFALRLRQELRPDRGASLRNDSGATGSKVWGQPARWIAYEGQVDGKPMGVACMAPDGNPGAPTRWHARTYGLAAANPFGLREFAKEAADKEGGVTIPAGDTLQYHWRTALYAGTRTPQELTAILDAWPDKR